jgi:hypothetical protein
MFSTPEERAIALKMLPVLQAKAIKLATASAEAAKAKELNQIVTELTAQNKKILDAKIEEYRKALTPPTAEELQKLLTQEFVTFQLKLRAGSAMRDFVIGELPMAAESRLMKMLNRTLGERLQEISRIDWKSSNTVLDRVVKICEMIPGAMDTVADCCAVALDPTGEDNSITGEWVRNNLGMSRIASIVMAQMEAGRYRDFLSLLSRLYPNSIMT